MKFKFKHFLMLFPVEGWYMAKITNYDRNTDIVKLEFNVEQVVKDEVKVR